MLMADPAPVRSVSGEYDVLHRASRWETLHEKTFFFAFDSLLQHVRADAERHAKHERGAEKGERLRGCDARTNPLGCV